MTLQAISRVAISLNTSGLTREGFGTLIFLTAHNFYKDRVRSYSDTDSIGNDTQTSSNAYAAGTAVFVNDPAPSTLKIGRVIADSVIAPDVLDDAGSLIVGRAVELTITDQNDDIVTASYTTVGGDTVADVVDELKTQIDAGGLDITTTDNGDTLTVARATPFGSGGDFIISAISNAIISAGTLQENIVDALLAINEVDSDWYGLAWENHTSGDDILDLLTSVESQEKLYFIGSSAVESINNAFTLGGTPAAADILARVADTQTGRGITYWHQDADTEFSELTFAAYNFPYDAGSVSWANLQVPMSNAKNPEGNKLTTTQEQNLADRNANWPSIEGNIVYTREGKVAGDEWIDNIRGRDNLQADIQADMFDILTNQQGTKVPYTDKGINVFVGALDKRLNLYKTDRNFLTDPITITVPKAKDITRDVKITRILSGLSFKAKLAGAINMTDIKGSLEP